MLNRKAWYWTALSAVASLALATPDVRAQADEPQVEEKVIVTVEQSDDAPATERRTRRFEWISDKPFLDASARIGVVCVDIPEALRPQLKLDSGAGVVVVEVVPEGPASKAGLKKGDILVSAGEARIGAPKELASAVGDSAGKEISLKIVRNGEVQELVVTPQASDRVLFDRPRIGLRAIQPGVVVSGIPALTMDEAEAGHKSGSGNVTFNVGFARSDKADLPDDVSVSISRQGNSPARVKITRGEEAWDVELDKVEELPEDVRGYVDALPAVRPFPGLDHVISFVPKVWDESTDAARFHVHREAIEQARKRGEELHERARKAAEEAFETSKKAAAEAAKRADDAVKQGRVWLEQQQGEVAKTIDVEVRDLIKSALDEAIAQQAKVEKAAEKIDFDDLERRMNDGFAELRKQIEALRAAVEADDEQFDEADKPNSESSDE